MGRGGQAAIRGACAIASPHKNTIRTKKAAQLPICPLDGRSVVISEVLVMKIAASAINKRRRGKFYW